MRHMVRGRQLSRDTEHRKSLRRSLVQSLFEHGRIRTTLPKAKEVKAFAEKLITLARTKSVNNIRRVTALMNDRRLVDKEQEFTGQNVVQKLFDEVAPRFVDRQGGYTRIIKLSDYRIGDGGSLVLLQLLTEESKPTGTPRAAPACDASETSGSTSSPPGPSSATKRRSPKRRPPLIRQRRKLNKPRSKLASDKFRSVDRLCDRPAPQGAGLFRSPISPVPAPGALWLSRRRK